MPAPAVKRTVAPRRRGGASEKGPAGVARSNSRSRSSASPPPIAQVAEFYPATEIVCKSRTIDEQLFLYCRSILGGPNIGHHTRAIPVDQGSETPARTSDAIYA